MNVIFSENFKSQICIIQSIVDNYSNDDYYDLYKRISLLVKGLSECNTIDGLLLGKRKHKGETEGRLGTPLGDCISRDLDYGNRFVALDFDSNSVVLSSIGHYDVPHAEGELFPELERQISTIKTLSTGELQQLQMNSKAYINDMLEITKNIILDGETVARYNDSVFDNKCPSIKSFLHKEEKLYKKGFSNIYSNTDTEEHLSVLKRAVTNDFQLSNSAALILGRGDAKNTLNFKYNILKIFSFNIFELIQSNSKYIDNLSNRKQTVLTFMCDAVVKTLNIQLELMEKSESDPAAFKSINRYFVNSITDDLTRLQQKDSIELGDYLKKTFEELLDKTVRFLQSLTGGNDYNESTEHKELIVSLNNFFEEAGKNNNLSQKNHENNATERAAEIIDAESRSSAVSCSEHAEHIHNESSLKISADTICFQQDDNAHEYASKKEIRADLFTGMNMTLEVDKLRIKDDAVKEIVRDTKHLFTPYKFCVAYIYAEMLTSKEPIDISAAAQRGYEALTLSLTNCHNSKTGIVALPCAGADAEPAMAFSTRQLDLKQAFRLAEDKGICLPGLYELSKIIDRVKSNALTKSQFADGLIGEVKDYIRIKDADFSRPSAGNKENPRGEMDEVFEAAKEQSILWITNEGMLTRETFSDGSTAIRNGYDFLISCSIKFLHPSGYTLSLSDVLKNEELRKTFNLDHESTAKNNHEQQIQRKAENTEKRHVRIR